MGATHLEVPLRPLEERDGVLDFLPSDIGILLERSLLSRCELAQVKVCVVRHRRQFGLDTAGRKRFPRPRVRNRGSCRCWGCNGARCGVRNGELTSPRVSSFRCPGRSGGVYSRRVEAAGVLWFECSGRSAADGFKSLRGPGTRSSSSLSKYPCSRTLCFWYGVGIVLAFRRVKVPEPRSCQNPEGELYEVVEGRGLVFRCTESWGAHIPMGQGVSTRMRSGQRVISVDMHYKGR
jgi:hypothetical protein